MSNEDSHVQDPAERRKAQARERSRRYYQRHREQVAERDRQRREQDPEKRAAQQSAWLEKNPEYHAEWRAENRDKVNEQQRARRAAKSQETRQAEQAARWENDWRRQVKSKYGITAEQYDAMLAAQGGKCALCGREGNVGGKRLAVDHCHGTGKVRGLLCNPCNTMLGNARDDVDLLTAAIAYVLAHRDILGGAST